MTLRPPTWFDFALAAIGMVTAILMAVLIVGLVSGWHDMRLYGVGLMRGSLFAFSVAVLLPAAYLKGSRHGVKREPLANPKEFRLWLLTWGLAFFVGACVLVAAGWGLTLVG